MRKMMAHNIHFKSYCWSVGTTSYRTDNFNMNIERQLALMKEFRELPQNCNQVWTGNNAFQKQYYDFLKSKNFVSGDAKRPDKDAREKTSGLRDIGLMDDERRITSAGNKLLYIAAFQNYKSDNLLEIPSDSFLYFKQLLKTCNDVDGKKVRPFLVFLYVVSKLNYLTYDEFTYLLPLCVDRTTTDKIIACILDSRKGSTNYEEIIISILFDMDNYKEALHLLQTQPLSEELICDIGINRKSSKYDKPYYQLYSILLKIVFYKEEAALELYEATKKLTNSKVGGSWRKYFFSSLVRSVIVKKGRKVLHNVPILMAEDMETFNNEFFKIMHLFKAKATLSDYFDLNRRYFKITDIVLFEDNRVQLDMLPRCYIEDIADELIEFAFLESHLINEDVPLKAIAACFEIKEDVLYKKLSQMLGVAVTDKTGAKKVIQDERYVRFNKLIDEKFSTNTLITLLTYFENREDNSIRDLVTDNADIPTIFEYVLGIAWYVISGREGNVLEYMNLSLEADLLPKTHAGGGEADIVWKYNRKQNYEKHTLLIEATLADGTNQRRMEMEPVSRHLGEYCLANPNDEAYCVFITTSLNNNVISDFRARKYMEYYNHSGTAFITGMKIVPLQTSELKNILRLEIGYPQIYQLLDSAYHSGGAPKEWYEECIVKGILRV